MTAPTNGGKPVELTLTFGKAISDITDNAVVLKICGGLAEAMAVPYSRVTDQWGGFYLNPSPTLPSEAPKPAADATAKTNTTNTTKATTRVLTTDTKTTTTATTTKTTTTATTKKEWKLNLVVQPDPFVKKADNDATKKLVTGDDALKAVNKVTEKTHGALTKANMAAATITEAEVKWVK